MVKQQHVVEVWHPDHIHADVQQVEVQRLDVGRILQGMGDVEPADAVLPDQLRQLRQLAQNLRLRVIAGVRAIADKPDQGRAFLPRKGVGQVDCQFTGAHDQRFLPFMQLAVVILGQAMQRCVANRQQWITNRRPQQQDFQRKY